MSACECRLLLHGGVASPWLDLPLPTPPTAARVAIAGGELADPTITLGGSQIAGRGDTVNVPVTISDDAFGLASADLTITYDTALLNLANADVTLNPALAAAGWAMARNANDAAGVLRVTLYTGIDPVTQHGPANLLNLAFHVPSDARAGTTAIALDASIDPDTEVARSRLNEGQFALTPVSGSIRVPIATSISGFPATSPEGTPIELTSACSGQTGAITYAWSVTRDGLPYDVSDNTAASFTFTPDTPGQYDVGVVVTDTAGAFGNASAGITVTHVTYRVTAFTPTASGFDVHMNRPASAGLLNLYATESVPQLPDVTLVGAAVGAVRGSLVWDSATRTAHFIKSGGILLPDDYTATLASRVDGWVDALGELLDGNADGTAGGDYLGTFTVAAAPARVVGLADFARGPGQTVNLPTVGAGIPIRISDGEGVTSVQLRLEYAASDLMLTNVTGAAGWSVDTTGSAPGLLVVSASGPALSDGAATLFTVAATVPDDARYGTSQVLRIAGLELNGGALAGQGDDALQKVAFPGDTTGDRSYSALDATDVSRVVVGLDTGFAAYLLTDPTIIGDVTGDGTLSGLDASSAARKSVGLPVPEIPDLPAGNATATPSGGIDPVLAVGMSVGAPGDIVDVPVSISSAAGLMGADMTLRYDTTVLDLSNDDVVLGGLPAGWTLVRNVDDAAGIVRISLYDADPLPFGSGPLVDLKFHIAATVPDSSAAVSLVTNPATASRLNEGQLPLTPVPGTVTIDAGLPALNVAGTVQLGVSGSFGTISIASGGRLNLAAGGSVLLRMASVIINPGGVLDLADNDLVLTGADAATLDTIRQYLSDGRIITSVTEPEPGHFATLAPIDNRLLHLRAWEGTPINDGSNFSQVIIKHAWVGDTNLDGVVSEDDYVSIIANQGQSGQWITGDLNGDGMVTPDDLAVVSGNLGAGLPLAVGPQLLASPPVAAAAAPAVEKAAPKVAPQPAAKARITVVKKPILRAKPHKRPVSHKARHK